MPYDTSNLPPLTPPQDTFAGGAAQQSKTDADGNNFIFDNAGGQWVFVGKRDFSAQPNAADATAELAKGLRALKVPEAGDSKPGAKPEVPAPSPVEQAAAAKTLTECRCARKRRP